MIKTTRLEALQDLGETAFGGKVGAEIKAHRHKKINEIFDYIEALEQEIKKHKPQNTKDADKKPFNEIYKEHEIKYYYSRETKSYTIYIYKNGKGVGTDFGLLDESHARSTAHRMIYELTQEQSK